MQPPSSNEIGIANVNLSVGLVRTVFMAFRIVLKIEGFIIRISVYRRDLYPSKGPSLVGFLGTTKQLT